MRTLAAETFPNSKVKGGWDFVGDAYNRRNTLSPIAIQWTATVMAVMLPVSAAGFGVKSRRHHLC